MELLEVTKQCVSAAVGLFKGQVDESAIKAHKSLGCLHSHYEEAFYMIENNVPITKLPTSMNKTCYIIEQPNQQIFKIFRGTNYICNCNKFNAKEFTYCPHILAVMMAEELQLCVSQCRQTEQEFLSNIQSYPN